MNGLKTNNNWRRVAKALFFSVAFLCLFASYTTNFLKVVDDETFAYFGRPDELKLITRLDLAQRDGFFSHGALMGLLKDSTNLFLPLNQDVRQMVDEAYIHFLHDEPIAAHGEKFEPYMSHPGGGAFFYSILHVTLPVSNVHKMVLYRTINSGLTALFFVLFVGWLCRNFSYRAGIITFILILLSPWITKFSHNLIWAFWNFYFPMVTMLLLLERKHKRGENWTVGLMKWVFILALLKCFITGFEFISSSLVAMACPIVYYAVLERRRFKALIGLLLKSILMSLLAIMVTVVLIVVQSRFAMGSFQAGIDHLIKVYLQRTTTAPLLETIYMMLIDYPFLPLRINFLIFIIFILLLAAGIYFYFRNKDFTLTKYKAYALTTMVSLAGPFAWYIIFKERAYSHPYYDCIAWFMPYFIYGFGLVGIAFSLLTDKLFVKNRLTTNSRN